MKEAHAKFFIVALVSIVSLLGIILVTSHTKSVIAIYPASIGTCSATGMYDCTWAGGDWDGDGLCNQWEEFYYGTDKWHGDTDKGGKCDGDEVLILASNPTNGNDDIA